MGFILDINPATSSEQLSAVRCPMSDVRIRQVGKIMLGNQQTDPFAESVLENAVEGRELDVALAVFEA